MASDELFTREEALAGSPARRAKTLLFLIESRTAHMVARSRRAMERYLSDEVAEDRDLAFLEAFALGKDPPLSPSIQDLEYHASQWAYLVPESPGIRAALAHLLGQKYTLPYAAVPGIRQVLGVDKETVQRAYQRQYRQPLQSIFTPQVRPRESMRWAWYRLAKWLETLPPFWTAFALTLTETVGASILALPIALAQVGPIAAVVLLVVLGLVNILTIMYVAETLIRSGSIRYGNAYFGRLVAEYLGNGGSFIFSLALALLIFLVLIAYYTGFATTLAAATPIPAVVWAGLLFFIGLYFLRRETLNATISSAILVGGINLALILILSLLAFTHLRLENLAYINIPFLNGRPFDASILQLVFGIILAAYFGHTSIANGAKIVLRRDPTGRSLIFGCVAAQAAAICVYAIWQVGVSGAISAQELASQTGTALVPLAVQAGPIVHLFGSIFALLALGMASVHFTLGTFNLVRERLPARRHPILVLPRRRGRLVFWPSTGKRESARFSLVYMGITDGQPGFRLDVKEDGRMHRLEATTGGQLDLSRLLPQSAGLGRRGSSLELHILDANQESARLQVFTSLNLTYEGEWDTAGFGMADILELPDEQRQLLQWILRRRKASLADILEYTGQPEKVVSPVLQALLAQGFLQDVEVRGEIHYRPILARKRSHPLPQKIRQVLDTEMGVSPDFEQSPGKLRGLLDRILDAAMNERGRFLLAASPVVVIFLITEWMLLNQAESFVKPLNFVGVIVVSLLGGIFPVLLLHASRHKGDISPGVVYQLLGHPVIAASIYLLSLANLILHGLVLWTDLFQRLIAIATAVLILWATVRIIRTGAFAPRGVVEIRQDHNQAGRVIFNSLANGVPAPLRLRLEDAEGEKLIQASSSEIPSFSSHCDLHFQLLETRIKELKVWGHQITPEGDSLSLPAELEVYVGEISQQYNLQLNLGQALIPLDFKSPEDQISFKIMLQQDRSDGRPDTPGLPSSVV